VPIYRLAKQVAATFCSLAARRRSLATIGIARPSIPMIMIEG
jgi:hypothetical protein